MSNPTILSDLVRPGKTAVLVVPIDKEAPKGRLILPQVQAIRDLLDGDATAIVCKERELSHTLEHAKGKAGAGGNGFAGIFESGGRHAG